MVPHTGQRPAGQASTAAPLAGLKRKAPTAKGKGVASADPGRLQLQAHPGEGKGKGKGKVPQAGKVKPVRRQGGVATGVKESSVVEDGEEKGKAKGKAKVKSDIDDIFAGVKRLKAEKAEEEAERAAKKKKMKEEHKRRQANPFTGEGGPERRWAWADEVKPVRFDDEGLPIYTWESLRIGQGGGTALCPFDCDCCF